MPIPALGEIKGGDIQELIDSLEKQRKELDWLLQSLDTSNVKELHADVINAGIINAKHIEVGSETTFQTGYSPSDLRIETETKFKAVDGEISARVKQTDFNLLGGRVATAESTLSVLPGQINAKVSYTDFNALGGRVSSAESTLSVLPGMISSKVEYSDYTGTRIASLINQTASNISISARAIDLNGITNVSSYLTLGTGYGSETGIYFKGAAVSIDTYGDTLRLNASDVWFTGRVIGLYATFG